MESKVRIGFGILLVFASAWLLECASLTPRHFRPVRDVPLPVVHHGSVTNTPIENVSSIDDATHSSRTSLSDNTTNNTNSVDRNNNKITNIEESRSDASHKSAVLTDKPKSIDNNYTDAQISSETKFPSTKERNREASRSLKIDIGKYISPDFHNKNNVYTLATSPEIEKYLDPHFDNIGDDETKTSSNKYFDSTPNTNAYNIVLTTPQTDIFDTKFRQVTDKIKQNLDELDTNFKYSADVDKNKDTNEKYGLPKLIENIQKADNETDIYLNAKEFKNIDINTGEKKINHEMEKGMSVDYKSTYMKTNVYPENVKSPDIAITNNISNTNEDEQEKAIELQPKIAVNQSASASFISKTIIPIKYTAEFKELQNISVNTTLKPTKKPRLQFSLHNNTIETTAPENEIKPKKLYTSTSEPVGINPLYQTERATYVKPLIENQINISKRGSVKFTVSQNETVTPNAIKTEEFDKKNFSIPPSATAWTLVTLKDLPNHSNEKSTDHKEDDEPKWIKLTTPPRQDDITTIASTSEQVTSSTVFNDYITDSPTTYTSKVTTDSEEEMTTLSQNQNEVSPTINEKTLNDLTHKEISSEKPTEVLDISLDEITTIETTTIEETTLSTTTISLESTESTTDYQTTKAIDLTTDSEISTTSIAPDITITSFETTTAEISTIPSFHTVTYDMNETTTTTSEMVTMSTMIVPKDSTFSTDSYTEVTQEPSTNTPISTTFTTTDEVTNNTVQNSTDSNELINIDKITEATIKSSVRQNSTLPRITQAPSTSKPKVVQVLVSTVEPHEDDIEDNNFGNDDNDYPELPAKKIENNKTETHESETNIHIENGGGNGRPILNKSSENEPINPVTTQKDIVLTTVDIENTTIDMTSSTEHLSHDDDTDDSNSGMVAAIAISTVGGICLILLAGLLLVMRKRQKKITYRQRCRPVSLDAYSLDNVSVYNSVRGKIGLRTSKRSYGNPAFDDPVSISHQMNFQSLAKFADNMEGIDAEFEEIPQITARANEVPAGCETKNRYANIIPLPETRVFLKPFDNDPHSDYINANYVTGPKNTRSYYIACQAPLQSTVDDFWRMIWEQQCRVVLMLTNLYENGVEKCADYLPPSEVLDCHRLFGDFQITLKKREVKEKYIISSLQLKNMVSNSWREVVHLWYLGWPERGVPTEVNSLIAFLIEARSHLKAAANNNSSENRTSETSNVHISGGANGVDGGPVVVHCSPGTGRTGTVVACDIAIRDFELTRNVDIPKIVYRVRRDRASAVQTREQYAFIYKVISLYATKLTGGALDPI